MANVANPLEYASRIQGIIGNLSDASEGDVFFYAESRRKGGIGGPEFCCEIRAGAVNGKNYPCFDASGNECLYGIGDTVEAARAALLSKCEGL